MIVNTLSKKKKILLVSILKPINDTRMYEKMGQTLAEESDVHLIGYPSQSAVSFPNITFHSLEPFSRLSIKRIMAPIKIFRKVIHYKPDILIITTHELLTIGVLSKLFLTCKLIYDVQENYKRNILYTNAFPKLLRPFIATGVRLKEWILSPFVNHFLLAERGYEKELHFPGNKKTIIENKTKREIILSKKPNDGNIHLLFTGTLAETTGVFTAIELAQQLHSVNPAIRLTIIGYCSILSTLKQIRSAIQDKSYIKLIGGDRLIPHSEIVDHIHAADFGIIAYAENPSITNSIPTKLYEYLGYQLPILMIGNQPGIAIAKPYQAVISISMSSLKSEAVLDQMNNQSFYTTAPHDVFWESEASKLKNAVLGA